MLGPCLLGITLRVLLVGSLLGACLKMAMFSCFLASGDLVRGGPCALSAALGGAGVCLASGSGGALKESDYTEKHQHTLLDMVFRVSRFVPGFVRDSEIQGVLILVFLGAKFLRVH